MSGSGGSSLSVLVADHSAAVQQALVKLAAELSLTVCGVTGDGGEAAALAWLYRPSLVLFDIRMPGPPGLDALAEVRSQSPGSRIVVLTSVSERSRVLACRSLGVADYVLKPFQPEALKARLARVIRGMEGGADVRPEPAAGPAGAAPFYRRMLEEARRDRALFLQAQAVLSQQDIEEVFHGPASA